MTDFDSDARSDATSPGSCSPSSERRSTATETDCSGRRVDDRRATGNGPDRRGFLRTGAAVGLAMTGLPGALAGFSGVAAADTDPGDVIWELDRSGVKRAPPTVVDDTVFFGGDGVYAADANTGERLWNEGLSAYEASPCVVDDRVFAAFNGERVIATETEPGEYGRTEVVWEYEMADRSGGSSPTAVDGTVYVGDSGGRLYALGADGGDEEWIFDEYDHPINASPTVVDGTVYVGAGDYRQLGGPTGGVYAIDADTGEVEWLVEHDADGFEWEAQSPTVVDGVVYVTAIRGGAAGDAALFAYDGETGEELWSVVDEGSMNTWGVTAPTIADGVLYVGSVDSVRAIDPDDGSLLWSVGTDSVSVPTVADGTVFVAESNGGDVIALDADTGDEVWREPPESDRYDGLSQLTGPLVVNGTLFVGAQAGTSGSMFAIDAGVDGHSEDSKVLLGTLGNHHEFAGTSAPTGGYDGPSEDDEDDEGDEDDESEEDDPDLLRGTITDPDTGDPIEGAFVTVRESGESDIVESGFTDGDGEYVFDVDPRSYDITVDHEDYGAPEFVYDVEVSAGEVTSVDVPLGADDPTVTQGDDPETAGADADADAEDDGTSSSDDEPDEPDDDGTPGPGIPGALAALGGAGYLLARRTSSDDDVRP